MKEQLRSYILGLGVDDVGFASVEDYVSANSPSVEALFPGARSIIVLAFRELAACESPSPQMAMGARLDLMEFSRSACYRVGRFVEGKLGSPAMTVPISYPMDFIGKRGAGEVSLRHAAVASGLGAFGHHHLVVHPRYGTRVLFTAVLTKLELASDPPVTENPCTGCGLCVQACPADAFAVEGKTDLMRCMSYSQPYGIGANIGFWSSYGSASADERMKMLQTREYLSIYQAGFIGYQYFCFQCLSVCPVGTRYPQE